MCSRKHNTSTGFERPGVHNHSVAAVQLMSVRTHVENWDHALQVEIMMALEEKFDLEIPEEEAEKISTVKEAADMIATAVRCLPCASLHVPCVMSLYRGM